VSAERIVVLELLAWQPLRALRGSSLVARHGTEKANSPHPSGAEPGLFIGEKLERLAAVDVHVSSPT